MTRPARSVKKDSGSSYVTDVGYLSRPDWVLIMTPESSSCIEQIYSEIQTTSDEYLPALLEIVQSFRHGLVLKPVEESFYRGMQDMMDGNTMPISELWKNIDV